MCANCMSQFSNASPHVDFTLGDFQWCCVLFNSIRRFSCLFYADMVFLYERMHLPLGELINKMTFKSSRYTP